MRAGYAIEKERSEGRANAKSHNEVRHRRNSNRKLVFDPSDSERQKTLLSISGSGVVERGGFTPCSSRHASCILCLSHHVLPLCYFISSDFFPRFLLNQLSAMLATRPSISSWCSTCQEIGSHQLQLMKQSRTYPLHHCTHDVATAISTVTLKRSATHSHTRTNQNCIQHQHDHLHIKANMFVYMCARKSL